MKRGPPNSPILYKHCPRPSYLSPPHLHSQRQSLISNLNLLSAFAYRLTSKTKSYRTLDIHPRCNSSPLSLCSPSPLRLPPLRSNRLPWSSSRALTLHLLLHLLLLWKSAGTNKLPYQIALPKLSWGVPTPFLPRPSSLFSNFRFNSCWDLVALVSRSSTCIFCALLKTTSVNGVNILNNQNVCCNIKQGGASNVRVFNLINFSC